jgi:hypothetical protein
MSDILDVCFQRLSIRPVTEQLVEHLLLDLPLTPAEVIDFGVDTENHYRALQILVRDACGDGTELEDEEICGSYLLQLRQVIGELDSALGNSARLNALVQTYVPEYARLVQFRTTWDVLLERNDKASKTENRKEISSHL